MYEVLTLGGQEKKKAPERLQVSKSGAFFFFSSSFFLELERSGAPVSAILEAIFINAPTE